MRWSRLLILHTLQSNASSSLAPTSRRSSLTTSRYIPVILPSFLFPGNYISRYVSLPTLLTVVRGMYVISAHCFHYLYVRRFDNPASGAATPTRQMTLNYLLPVNAWLLLCPDKLCCDWTMGTIPLLDSWMDVRNVATLCFYASLAKLVHYSVTRTGRRVRAVIMVTAATFQDSQRTYLTENIINVQ